ncbi:MAG: GNAT family N-acetyltransferase [Gammaproteobacteria bacterium]|nr:GNAT family N-acetyltransferase [Gammaproteobacteria bacterium]MDH5730560.1 GNAT family N-acetyltransferase [Gammaproteobacteria bacterium]
MVIELVYLADKVEALKVIAAWYEDEWGYLRNYSGADSYESRLQEYMNVDEIPLMVVALSGGAFIGAAQLKRHEMDIYPQYEFWLGGVYVEKSRRGNGVAAQIVQQILREAKRFNVSNLYLQTEQLDGGLYRRLGWQPIEQVSYLERDVLVMQRPV